MNWKLNLDALGVTASIACAIHCAVLPLFFSALPLFGVNILHNFWFEAGMVALAFLIGARSFQHGYQRHHHRMLPFALFSIGIVLLIFKLFFVHLETWLLVPAVLLVISAHYLNFQFCRVHEREGTCVQDHAHKGHVHKGHIHKGHAHPDHSSKSTHPADVPEKPTAEDRPDPSRRNRPVVTDQI